jgi:hypothetical protein
VVYLAQQVTQFRRLGKDFAMQHLGVDTELVKVMRDLWDTLSPEEREDIFPTEQRLKGVPVEQRLAGIPPEDRLKGLAPEDVLKGLTPEERERLRRLLQLPQGEGQAVPPE